MVGTKLLMMRKMHPRIQKVAWCRTFTSISSSSNPRLWVPNTITTAHRKCSTSPQQNQSHIQKEVPAFAFDIDGVLQRGDIQLDAGMYAMKRLHDEHGNPKYPIAFLTNGGGHTEHERAEKLSRMFNIKVSDSQIVLSHTPMKYLADRYNSLKDTAVLCVGKRDCTRVARYYGFERPISSQDLGYIHSLATPLSQYPTVTSVDFAYTEADGHSVVFSEAFVKYVAHLHFSAVFVMHDSNDWGRDIQLICDIVAGEAKPSPAASTAATLLETETVASKKKNKKSKAAARAAAAAAAAAAHPNITVNVPLTQHIDPGIISDQTVDVYFSNPDFIWPNETIHPRLGQGAFRIALCAVYQELTGHPLKYEQFGKPNLIQYKEVRKRLEAQLKPNQRISSIFAVGDNPKADIRGANAAGNDFVSVLVKTGVHQDSDDLDPEERSPELELMDTPDLLVNTVADAVDFALEEHAKKVQAAAST